MRNSPSIRRLVELLALAVVLFAAVLGTGLLLRDNELLAFLDSLRVLKEIRSLEREEARRFGAHLEARRENEVAAVGRSLAELRESRGAFRGGISALAIDAEERVLVGGTGPSGFLLGMVRFFADGRLDERFFDHVSRAFEDDTVVGGVSQLLILEDGRILAVGSFKKPGAYRFRRDDRHPVGFALLDDSGRVDESWTDALWAQWPEGLYVSAPVALEGSVITFLGRSALHTLRVLPEPHLSPPIDLGGRRLQTFCPLSETELLVLAGSRLEIFDREGRAIREVHAPDQDLPGSEGGWKHLFCDDPGRALAVFERIDRVLDFDVMISVTSTRILLIEGGEVVTEAPLPEAIRPVAARYSERLGRWLVYGGLGRQYGLLTVGSERPFAKLERPLSLHGVTAMVERPDGRLIVAARAAKSERKPGERPMHLFELYPGEPVPF